MEGRVKNLYEIQTNGKIWEKNKNQVIKKKGQPPHRRGKGERKILHSDKKQIETKKAKNRKLKTTA